MHRSAGLKTLAKREVGMIFRRRHIDKYVEINPPQAGKNRETGNPPGRDGTEQSEVQAKERALQQGFSGRSRRAITQSGMNSPCSKLLPAICRLQFAEYHVGS
jgi:hypothetical protein